MVKAKENPIRNTLGGTLWPSLSIESNKNTLKTHGLLSNNSRITSQSAESYWVWMLMRQSNSRHVSNSHWFLCSCGVKTVLSTITAELTIDPPAALDQSKKQASGATGPWMKSIFLSITDMQIRTNQKTMLWECTCVSDLAVVLEALYTVYIHIFKGA